MKKALRITLWILAALVILLLALVVAVQSPAVQTILARKAVDKLSENIDGDISLTPAEHFPARIRWPASAACPPASP